MRRGLVAAAILAGTAGCASVGPAPPGQGVVGCYQFAWDDAAATLGLPWGFEVLEGALEGWPGLPEARRARTRLTATVVRDHPFGYWRSLAGDSIRVGSPGGGGFSLSLRRDGRDLEGEARPVGDAVEPGGDFGLPPARAVRTIRVVCPPTEAPAPRIG